MKHMNEFNATKKEMCEYLACCNTRFAYVPGWERSNVFYKKTYNDPAGSYKHFYNCSTDDVVSYVEWCNELYYMNNKPFTFEYYREHAECINIMGLKCFNCPQLERDCAGGWC